MTTAVSADTIKNLREKTGAGMMDCKVALKESNGDFEKAVDFLRKKGLSVAQKKSARVAAEGTIGSYIHSGKIGVMVEVNCETDFVGKNADFVNFVKDVAMHIAAADPKFLRKEEMDQDFLKREEEIYVAQLREQGRPANIIPQILKGKMEKLAEEVCLYEQRFVKDTDKTIKDLLTDLTLKLGEKIEIRRFVKYHLGEGIEKKQDNLAEEVQKLTQTAG